MICKLVLFASVAALVSAQADRYPAGVDPHLCPNYPHCDNALLALAQSGNPHGAPVHQPLYAPAIPSHYAAHPGVPAAAQYPAGVNPASCPNYPYCTGHPGAAVAAAPPLQGFASRLYPDGVSPHQCPNYPYCH